MPITRDTILIVFASLVIAGVFFVMKDNKTILLAVAFAGIAWAYADIKRKDVISRG